MSSESKKNKVNMNVKDLPFDCFSHAILFLKSRDDWLNLMLVIKGIFSYVKMNPKCMRNIELRLRNLPVVVCAENENRYNHVRNLVCGRRNENFDEYKFLENIGFNEFFNDRLTKLFGNLEKLEACFILKNVGISRKEEVVKRVGDSFRFENTMVNLKCLELTLFNMNIDFLCLFPKLECLKLTNGDARPLTSVIRNKLTLCAKMLPNLRVLELSTFDLRFKMTEFGNRLQVLTLNNCVSVEEELTEIENLENQSIFERRYIQNIGSLSNLNSLHFTWGNVDCVKKISIVDCPNLEYLSINVGGGNDPGSIILKKLPKLKKLRYNNSVVVYLVKDTLEFLERIISNVELPSLRKVICEGLSFTLKDFNSEKVENIKSVMLISRFSRTNVLVQNCKFLEVIKIGKIGEYYIHSGAGVFMDLPKLRKLAVFSCPSRLALGRLPNLVEILVSLSPRLDCFTEFEELFSGSDIIQRIKTLKFRVYISRDWRMKDLVKGMKRRKFFLTKSKDLKSVTNVEVIFEPVSTETWKYVNDFKSCFHLFKRGCLSKLNEKVVFIVKFKKKKMMEKNLKKFIEYYGL